MKMICRYLQLAVSIWIVPSLHGMEKVQLPKATQRSIFGEIEELLKCIRTIRELEEGKAYFLSKEYDRAFELFEKTLAQTDLEEVIAEAHYYLGCLHYRGLCRSSEFYKAKSHFEKAAQQEIKKDTRAAAQYYIGRIYYHATGVNNDRSKAHSYFIQSSLQEDNEEVQIAALCYLSVMYLRGEGIAKDLSQAFVCMKKILDKGYTKELKELFTKLHGPLVRESNLDESILHEAASFGDGKVVKFFIEKGARADALNKIGMTPLHYACKAGSLSVVKCLHGFGVPLHVFDKRTRTTPLYLACENGHKDIVEYLLKQGVDKEMKPFDGMSHAHIACQNGHTEIVKLLVEAGASIESSNDRNLTLINRAYEKNNRILIVYLISKKAPLEIPCVNGERLLLNLFDQGDFEAVNILMDAGANLRGLTLRAFLKNEIVKLKNYIEGGAEIESTLLLRAYEKGDLELVTFLIAHDAPMNVVDEDGCPLILKVYLNGPRTMVKSMVDKGCSIDFQKGELFQRITEITLKKSSELIYRMLEESTITRSLKIGTTLLHEAAEAGDVDLIDYLLKKGAQTDALDGNRMTMLHRAVKKNKIELVRFLLDKGITLNLPDAYDITALNDACADGFLDIVQLLHQRGALLDIAHSPLYDACAHGHRDVVRYLVEQGRKIAIDDVEIAITNDFKEIVGYLLAQEGVQGLLIAESKKRFFAAVKSKNQMLVQWYVESEYAKALIEEIRSIEGLESVVPLLMGIAELLEELESLEKGEWRLNHPNNFVQSKDEQLAALLRNPKSAKAEKDEKNKEINEQKRVPASILADYTCLASRLGKFRFLEFLLDVGCKPDYGESSGLSTYEEPLTERVGLPAIMFASYFGHLPAVKLLKEKEADISGIHSSGMTALGYALLAGHHEVATYLLNSGSYAGNNDFLKLLFAHHAIETRNAPEMPLFLRSEEYRLELLRLFLKQVFLKQDFEQEEKAMRSLGDVSLNLIQYGPEGTLFEKDSHGRTSLHAAAAKNSATTINLLRDVMASGKYAGASWDYHKTTFYDLQDNSGNTALHVAAFKGCEESVKCLLGSGDSKNIKNKAGKTPFMLACLKGHIACAEALFSAGDQDSAGDTPLHKACLQGDGEVVHFLLQKGRYLDLVNRDGDAPLYLSACLNEQDIVEKLLSADAQVDKVGGSGLTPLQAASLFGHATIVKALIEKGGNTEVKDKNGMTPLDFARENKDEASIKILEDDAKQKEQQKIMRQRIEQLFSQARIPNAATMNSSELQDLEKVLDPLHIAYLGEIYLRLCKDYERAKACFRKVMPTNEYWAPEIEKIRHIPLVWACLGEMNFHGYGTPIDRQKACEFFLRVAGGQDYMSILSWQLLVQRSSLYGSTSLIRKISEEKIAGPYETALAQAYLGEIYLDGIDDRNKSPRDALAYITLAENQEGNQPAKERARECRKRF